jgi:fumarylacetoacetase
MTLINATHDPALMSWVESANDPAGDFPIQNLPFGVYSRRGTRDTPRVGVAIGDQVLDIAAGLAAGVFDGLAAEAARACEAPALNRLMALGSAHWSALRAALSSVLGFGAPHERRLRATLTPQADVDLHVPAAIGDYSDFFASIHHATNAGSLFRPNDPLLPNYKHVPVAYHGRASSIVASGTRIKRPVGQTRKPNAARPELGPSRRLDYELEVGFYIGPGNALGERIALGDAERHVFGLCLVNDWSARDIQAWEYQPLGPFLGKSFATTVSPWVVTLEALAPFRTRSGERSPGDPRPLPYLDDDTDRASGSFEIELEVALSSARMREGGIAPQVLGATRLGHLYWSLFQMVAHHTVNGCNLRPGDLIATGTVSGPERHELGSLLEVSRNGAQPFELPSAESRTFLEDGDEVVMRAHCRREGFRGIGFGECRGLVEPAQV